MDPKGGMESVFIRKRKDKGGSSFLFLYESKAISCTTGGNTCSYGSLEAEVPFYEILPGTGTGPFLCYEACIIRAEVTLALTL
jgi:hypothetical protein